MQDPSDDVAPEMTYSYTRKFEGATFVKASFEGRHPDDSPMSADVTMAAASMWTDSTSTATTCSSAASSSTGSTWCRLWMLSSTGSSRAASCRRRRPPTACARVGPLCSPPWQTTVAGTPPDLVDAHVEDEWSLDQTLRHLILATDAWLRGGILRMQQPFHEIGLIFTGADEMGFDMSIFRTDPPAYAEILAVRAERLRSPRACDDSDW